MAVTAGHEVLLSTEASGQQCSLAAWDVGTGSCVSTRKGLAVAARCLCLRANHTLIGASQAKPVLQLWPLSKKEESQQKIVCPGRVSALAVSPDGLFCIAGIADKVYIWEMSAGGLLCVLSDYDEVKVIRFTDDGSQFVTGSTGGILTMWEFTTVVSRTAQRAAHRKHRHRVHAHSQAVTDIHVGCGGPAARVATSSEDMSCKLWDMVSGQLIKTLIYQESVYSVIMDAEEKHLIAGLGSGSIWSTPLYGQASQTEEYVTKNMTKAGERVFQEHCDVVTCLALSSDGTILASGSKDKTVRVWNMHNGGCSLTLPHPDTVTNVLMLPAHLLSSAPAHHRPTISFQHQMAREEGGRGRVVNITIPDNSQCLSSDYTPSINAMLALSAVTEPEKQNSEELMDMSDEVSSLQKEVARLKQVNQDLYTFVTKKIVSK